MKYLSVRSPYSIHTAIRKAQIMLTIQDRKAIYSAASSAESKLFSHHIEAEDKIDDMTKFI